MCERERDRDRKLLEDIATALEYPGRDFAGRLALARHAEPALAGLGRYLAAEGKERAEERYTQLFDLSPVCTLHLGYHLFGDTYDRGELLSGLVSEVKKAGIDLEGELPDFLPVLLRLLARTADEEARTLLVELVFLPALEKMNASLETATDPWSGILAALPGIVRRVALPGAKEVPVHA